MVKKRPRTPRTQARRAIRVGTARARSELIVMVSDAAGPATARRGPAVRRAAAVERIVQRAGIQLQPLFGVSEERLEAERASARFAAPLPRLDRFYRVEAPVVRLNSLARELAEQPSVLAAYVKPPTELPRERLNTMAAAPQPPPPVTPTFLTRQGYLAPSPSGVDAFFAWTQQGGRGEAVRIIDIEGGWRFSHEDLVQNQGGLAGGTMIDEVDWRNHGNAVLGEIGADDNPFGVTGICPGANTRAVSHGGIGSAAAIRLAATMLQPGDILLLEMHRPGPRFNFQLRDDQRGYIAVEWWPDDYEAIRYATARGVVVVEAAGNGAESLDDVLYDTPQAGFPSAWRNPFRRSPWDSGAIVVGAGAPPPGTHGRNHGPDRSRLDFSNSGACVDAQGWGREVTTVGYGDLQGGDSEDLWYTDRFSGTSSASPIVTGVIGCLQGIRRARGEAPLSPSAARHLLRTTGARQQSGPNGDGRIGSRPDLRQLIAAMGTGGGSRIELRRPVPTIISHDPELRHDNRWRAVIEDAGNPGHRVIIDFKPGSFRVTWQNPSGEDQTEWLDVSVD